MNEAGVGSALHSELGARRGGRAHRTVSALGAGAGAGAAVGRGPGAQGPDLLTSGARQVPAEAGRDPARSRQR